MEWANRLSTVISSITTVIRRTLTPQTEASGSPVLMLIDGDRLLAGHTPSDCSLRQTLPQWLPQLIRTYFSGLEVEVCLFSRYDQHRIADMHWPASLRWIQVSSDAHEKYAQLQPLVHACAARQLIWVGHQADDAAFLRQQTLPVTLVALNAAHPDLIQSCPRQIDARPFLIDQGIPAHSLAQRDLYQLLQESGRQAFAFERGRQALALYDAGLLQPHGAHSRLRRLLKQLAPQMRFHSGIAGRWVARCLPDQMPEAQHV